MSNEYPKPSGDCITDRIRQRNAQRRHLRYTVAYRAAGMLLWVVPGEASDAEDKAMAHQWTDDEAVGVITQLIKNGVRHIEIDLAEQ